MVVNRKQPAAPVPLIQSRSTSQQPIVMRKKQSKSVTSTNSNGVNSHTPENKPFTNPKPKAKSTSRRRLRKKSLRDKLFFWSLSLFALYSFLICSPYTTSPQKAHSHLICRAETNYKTYILEPFIFPPLKQTFSYTHSLAKPYISQANTHLEPYIASVKQATSTVKPYIVQTAITTKRIWTDTLTPFYKNTLKPYYQSAIVPRYNLYLRPYLLPLVAYSERYYAYYISNPIRIQSNRVQLHFSNLYATCVYSYLQPYIHRITSTVHTTWLSSVDFYDTHIQPTLLSTWTQAQPHLSFAFNQAKDISLNAAAGATKQLKILAKQVGTQRRTYVDPHIRRILDKVEENATAKMTTAPPAPVDVSLEGESAESTIIASPVIHEAKPIPSAKESDTPTNVPVPEEDAQDILHPAESTPPPPTSSSPSHPASTPEAEAQSAVSIAEASAHGASTALYELEREVEAALGGNTAHATIRGTVEESEPKPTEIVRAEAEAKYTGEQTFNEPAITSSAQEESSAESTVASLGNATNHTPNAGAAAAGVVGAGASPSISITTGEDDLDDFLRDIGVDTPPSPSPTFTQPTEADKVAALASAQKAESSRLASIASKRLEITTRHATFESDLQSSILNSTSQVIDKINEMRKAKRKELIGMIEGTQGEGEGLVAGLTSGADKLMKGLEVYLKKCEERSETWKRAVGDSDNGEDIQKRTGLAKDEQIRLESVIEKVEIKFLDVVQKLQEKVNGWYLGAIEKEHEEISKIKTGIKNMAEQAQANLGLDYAWLEDVTYLDWQRYHDLMRAFENFEETANAIQSGTSLDPPSPPNPIKPVIDALQEELQTVVLGLDVALRGVRSTIPELFNTHGPIPIDGVGAGVGEEEDKVKIQPIDPNGGCENTEKTRPNEEDFDVSQVIIGKSKEQVEQALGDVPLVVKHEEL